MRNVFFQNKQIIIIIIRLLLAFCLYCDSSDSDSDSSYCDIGQRTRARIDSSLPVYVVSSLIV